MRTLSDKQQVEAVSKMSINHIAELIVNCPVYEGDFNATELIESFGGNRQCLVDMFREAEDDTDFEWDDSVFAPFLNTAD